MDKDHGRKLLLAVAAACLPLAASTVSRNASAADPDQASAHTDRHRPREHRSRITFTDIAKRASSGIDYRRTRSRHDALWGKLRSQPVVPIFDFPAFAPVRSRGAPGVAVLDFDRDGDLDIYVTNGPGSPNSLYSSQLAQGRGLTFVDVAARAGVTATEQDSTGVCYGDTDNDGDYDLYVLGLGEQNKLFANNGKGRFTDVTSRSEAGGKPAYSTACSMGDVNGDGLLDIVIANTNGGWDNAFAPTEHNELLLNRGNNQIGRAHV